MSEKKKLPKFLEKKTIIIEDGDDSKSPVPPTATMAKIEKPPMSTFTKGLILILISSLVISFQNIVTKVILTKQTILGIWETGAYIKPGMGNSILILIIRMLIVLPIMALIVAPRIHNNTWNDIKSLRLPENKTRLYASLASGFFLFLSFFSIYLALGSRIPTGVATTLFFIYPTVTILIAWLAFKEKPSLSLIFAMITIYIGGFLCIPQESFATKGEANILFGASFAALSGAAFACYVTMIKLAKMHPAPFSITTFTIVLILSSISLFFFKIEVPEGRWDELFVACLILSMTTLVGYLLNNYGVPIIGPALASVISASGPAVTAVMALSLINETMNLYQIVGVFLVTLWVLGISVENMKKQQVSQPKPNN
ncbi:MAG: DMT family transporter [Leptospiraceae bacterium]|nr:DMT family transporter [Leptospiraceae bacterium]